MSTKTFASFCVHVTLPKMNNQDHFLNVMLFQLLWSVCKNNRCKINRTSCRDPMGKILPSRNYCLNVIVCNLFSGFSNIPKKVFFENFVWAKAYKLILYHLYILYVVIVFWFEAAFLRVRKNAMSHPKQ